KRKISKNYFFFAKNSGSFSLRENPPLASLGISLLSFHNREIQTVLLLQLMKTFAYIFLLF
ncbi:MAG: hypothetical protein IJ859_08255, partial [Synergistaceae bacterium]|nr:hypothetical protein [Synergistaceae bacterium]